MPLSRSALKQILAGAVDDSTEAIFLPIRNDGVFYQLWDLELFRRINLVCGTLIDDYESEWLEPEQIQFAVCEVNQFLKTQLENEVCAFLSELSAMMERAAGSRLPLLFAF